MTGPQQPLSMPTPTRRELLCLAAGAVAWPAAAQAALGTERRQLFGSAAELTLPATASRQAAAEVWRGLAAMNAGWNAWKPGELSRLNHAFAQGRQAPVSAALQRMIRQAAWLEQASDGCFNPAIGGLVGAWGFHDDLLGPGPRPDAATLARWRAASPSLAQIRFDGGLARSSNPRVQVDMGAYAKGVAIDWALDRLQRQGIVDALLNLGGNLATSGRPAGRPWRVGVRDPHGPGLVATIETLGREAVVTSGSYERSRLLDGQRCCHILDPLTGAPADAGPAPALVSVTVVHASAAFADAAATALLVAGPQRWQAVARRLGVQQLLLIDSRGRRHASAALAQRLQPPAADRSG